MTPFAQLEKSAGLNPLTALRMAAKKFPVMGRAASDGVVGHKVPLREMDFLSRGAKPGGEPVGSVGKQLRYAVDDARAAMGTARGSAERGDLAETLRYLRNGGIQYPFSKTTVSRFGVRQPTPVSGLVLQPRQPMTLQQMPPQLAGSPHITGVSDLSRGLM